jgi:hypothetical protein
MSWRDMLLVGIVVLALVLIAALANVLLPQGEGSMSKALLIICLPLMLAGCITDQDVAYLDRYTTGYLDRYYTRADVNAINAEMACKQLARTLVQVARCTVAR